MSQAPKKTSRKTAIQRGEAASPSQAEFDEVLALIDAAKARAVAAVNTTLIDLYWHSASTSATRSPLRPGDSGPSGPWPNTSSGVIRAGAGSRQATSGGCGSSSRPTADCQNSHRCCENCRGATTCSIMSRCKRDEEREFYLRFAARERWPFRELERQLAGALFERVVLSPAKLSAPLTELHPDAAAIFKDTLSR